MRNLVKVIDQIVEVAPDLEQALSGVKRSYCYAAPEAHSLWWWQAASILNSVAKNHPKSVEIDFIFGDRGSSNDAK